MRLKIVLLLLLQFLLLTNSCKRIVTEEITPQPEGNHGVTFLQKPYISDKAILVTQDAEIKAFTKTQITFASFKGLHAIRDADRGGRVENYDIQNLREGSILVAYEAEGAERGFLIKVKSVSTEAGNIVVDYVDAKLDELFQDIHFKFSAPLTFELPLSSKIKIENATDEKGVKSAIELSLDGLYARNYTTEVEYQSKDHQTTIASCVTNETSSMQLSFKMVSTKKMSFTTSTRIPLGYVLKSFPIKAGPVTIRLNFLFDVYGKVDANAKAINLNFKLINKRIEKVSGNTFKDSKWENVDRTVSNKDEAVDITALSSQGEVSTSVKAAFNVSYFNQNNVHKSGDLMRGMTSEVGYAGKFRGVCDTKKGLAATITSTLDGRGYIFFDLATAVPNYSFPFRAVETPNYSAVLQGICSDQKEPDPIDNQTTETYTAASTSDPHLRTFDNANYSFMAAGEFTAIKATNNTFEVQVRQQEIAAKSNNGTVSWNTGLAVRTGTGDICIYPPNRVFVNRTNIGTTFTTHNLTGGGKIDREGNKYTITTLNGDVVNLSMFDTNFDYYVTLNENRKAKIKGLFGNFDGASTNDLQIQGGASITGKYTDLYPKYTDSWRIKQAESIFVYDAGKNTESYTDRNFPRTPVNLTSAQRTRAKTICEAEGITDPILLENCIIDVGSTNDNTIAQRIYSSQINTSVLRNFAVGSFSTSDVKLDYFGATATNNQAYLDTKTQGFSRILMKQGVDIRKGFETEFSFSTQKIEAETCFFLALWPTGSKTRTSYQTRVGFCFGNMDNMSMAYYTIASDPTASTILAENHNVKFIDGLIHRVKIVNTPIANQKWRVQVFLDNMITAIYTHEGNESIANTIHAENGGVGYIEFQINKGNSSNVKLFNWSFKSL